MTPKCSQLSPSAAFQTEGKLYLILDFLRGGDLFTRLSKEVHGVQAVSFCLEFEGQESTGGLRVCACVCGVCARECVKVHVHARTCVCARECESACTCTHMCGVCARECVKVCVHARTCMCARECVKVCVHACTCICSGWCVYVYVCVWCVVRTRVFKMSHKSHREEICCP